MAFFYECIKLHAHTTHNAYFVRSFRQDALSATDYDRYTIKDHHPPPTTGVVSQDKRGRTTRSECEDGCGKLQMGYACVGHIMKTPPGWRRDNGRIIKCRNANDLLISSSSSLPSSSLQIFTPTILLYVRCSLFPTAAIPYNP